MTPDEKRASAVALAVLILNSEVGLPAHRSELLSICVWKYTEAHGKYKGCRYWTKAALSAEKLTHEHVVPRKQLVQAMVDLETVTEQSVAELLSKMAMACVIDRNEHALLPEATWAELLENPWVRYAGVEVVDTADLDSEPILP